MPTEHLADRPSPDALLAAAAREGRGRLKVFLGAAPGVGKTYAMLKAAHERKAEGIDVVVGLIETHSRRETEALVAGLELLPRRQVAYRGQSLGEFDLDAALARRPGLVLVDELAHSNAPGSRHPKRYQDVDELLDAGIDVYTTLNVQHLESLNDVVARITRIRVRETLPDRVLEEADDVTLVDLTPSELIKRLADGKVYVEGQAKRAVQHFFQPGNLTALRELALRRTADRVDDQMVDYMREHAIVGPWAAGERILVCIGADEDSIAVVRAARRLADQLHAPWTALYVEMPGHFRLGQEERVLIAQAQRLAEELGGESETIPGRDLPEDLLRFAGSHNMTQIVIGRRPVSWLRRLLGRSLVDELVGRSQSVAVHVVPVGGKAGRSGMAALNPRRIFEACIAVGWQPYALATTLVGAAGLIAAAVSHLMPLPNLSMFFIVAVLVVAITRGLSASIYASVLSFLAYNFFFIPPIYTLSVTDGHDLIALFIFLITAVLTSSVASRVRDQAEDARRRAKTVTALYDFSRKLSSTVGFDDLLWAVSFQVASTLQGRVVVLLKAGDDKLDLVSAYPPEDELEAGAWTAARWAFEKGEAAGHDTDTLPTVPWRFMPLTTPNGAVGALGFRRDEPAPPPDPEALRVLTALADQAAVAIERSRFNLEVSEARVLAETEKLRAALLSSISHDLRTPLATIIGAVSSLKGYGESYSPAVRADLLATVEEEAERLNRFVGNLLDMTRLEAGVLAPSRNWVDLGELISGAVARVRRMGARRIEVELAPALPLVRVDFVLMEQVLFNLIENATKYAPVAAPINVAARAEGDEIVIEVADEGPGIPEADLERVFDKFYRIKAGDRQAAGTGLGLAICRGIVEAHRGRISAHSPGPSGRGALFTIRLPLERHPTLPSEQAA